jgi:hypothetical protein
MTNKPFPKGLNIKGLKCDSCSYKNLDVEFKGLEDMKNYIDVPCPICGESLLTKEDFRIVETLYVLYSNPLIRLINFLGKLFGKGKTYKVHLNGTGSNGMYLEEKKE